MCRGGLGADLSFVWERGGGSHGGGGGRADVGMTGGHPRTPPSRLPSSSRHGNGAQNRKSTLKGAIKRGGGGGLQPCK